MECSTLLQVLVCHVGRAKVNFVSIATRSIHLTSLKTPLDLLVDESGTNLILDGIGHRGGRGAARNSRSALKEIDGIVYGNMTSNGGVYRKGVEQIKIKSLTKPHVLTAALQQTFLPRALGVSNGIVVLMRVSQTLVYS